MSSVLIEPSDGISVIELPGSDDDATGTGVFGGVFGAYQRHGYEAGYSHAVHDVVGSVALAAADFLREHRDAPQEVREVLRQFEALVQLRLEALITNHFVEGGLGI
jgi:hypothetical protein